MRIGMTNWSLYFNLFHWQHYFWYIMSYDLHNHTEIDDLICNLHVPFIFQYSAENSIFCISLVLSYLWILVAICMCFLYSLVPRIADTFYGWCFSHIWPISVYPAAYAKYRGPLGNVRKGVLVYYCFFNLNFSKFVLWVCFLHFNAWICVYKPNLRAILGHICVISNCLNLVQQVSMGHGTTTAYALMSLEPRGILFATPGMEVAWMIHSILIVCLTIKSVFIHLVTLSLFFFSVFLF